MTMAIKYGKLVMFIENCDLFTVTTNQNYWYEIKFEYSNLFYSNIFYKCYIN